MTKDTGEENGEQLPRFQSRKDDQEHLELSKKRDRKRKGRKPAVWTAADRDYENLRIGMQALFQHLGIHAALPATYGPGRRQTICDHGILSG